MLQIKNLHTIAVDDGSAILKGLDLNIKKGEVHVIMGPNGSGKSTLANTIFANPRYEITEGSIIFEGNNINDLDTAKRARLGMFLSFQTPVELPGISIANFLKTAKTNMTGEKINLYNFSKETNKLMDQLHISNDVLGRDLNVGFSGGEKKKLEMLQLLTLNPKLAILDETDSGLDGDAVKIVREGIKMFKNSDNAVLIITHSTKILEDLGDYYVHVLVNGKIVKTGDKSLALEIDKFGYKDYLV